MKNIKTFEEHSVDMKKLNLSKDMKKQGHTGQVNTKPNSKKTLEGEKSLAKKPPVGKHREPSNKKLSSEEFLAAAHKAKNITDKNIKKI